MIEASYKEPLYLLKLNRLIIDQRIIKNCLKGKRKAQHELYQIYFKSMIGTCMRYYKNKEDAVDMLNQAFLKILTNLDRYTLDTNFEAWSRTVTIRTVINDLKKNKTYKDTIVKTDSEDNFTQSKNFNTNSLNEQLDVESLLYLLHQLPEREKQVLNLYAIDGYNHREIGEILDIPEGTSKWLLSEARKRMKTLMKKEFPEYKNTKAISA